MGNLSISEDALNDPNAYKLIPIEQEVDGKMQKIEHLAEITSASEVTFKTGKKGLRIQFGIDSKGNRIYVNETFNYDPNFLLRLSNFIKLLGLSPKGITEEAFLGRFVWVTIKHDSYVSTTQFDSEGNAETIIDNKIDKFIRPATPEEVAPVSSGDSPF